MKRSKIMRKTVFRIVAAGLLCGPLWARAENIVYHVDRAFGGATIIGTIETDGTIGALAPGNIVSWSLEADDGSGEHAPITIGSSTVSLGILLACFEIAVNQPANQQTTNGNRQ